MYKKIINCLFKIPLSTPLVLILEPLEETTHEVARKLIESFPGRIKALYFLGNLKFYNILVPRDFSENSPCWFNENKGRVPLIGPIFELLKDFPGTIAVVTSRLPVDIEDWFETDILKRTIFIRTTEKQLHPDIVELPANSLSEIKAALENPVVEIIIKGKNFVPLQFKTEPMAEIEVIYEKNEFILKITPSHRELELHLLAFGNQMPLLYLKRAKGNTEIIKGQEEKPYFSEFIWQKIPEDIKPIFFSMISKEPYKCPYCNEFHNYDCLLCPKGQLILRGIQLDTFILFTEDTYLPFSEGYAYLLNDNEIVTKDGMVFRWEDEKWQLIKKIKFFDEVSNGVWGLFHRI